MHLSQRPFNRKIRAKLIYWFSLASEIHSVPYVLPLFLIRILQILSNETAYFQTPIPSEAAVVDGNRGALVHKTEVHTAMSIIHCRNWIRNLIFFNRQFDCSTTENAKNFPNKSFIWTTENSQWTSALENDSVRLAIRFILSAILV